MKDGRAKIGYGYILVPMDFPDYDTIPNYEEWEDEVMDSGYFHYVGPDKEMFFGIIMEETDSFVEIDEDVFGLGQRQWFDCRTTFERLFPNSDSFHAMYLIEEYE